LRYCVAHPLTGRYVLGAINIMDHRRDIDEIEASIVTQISDYWGSVADDFCTSESTNIPFQRFVLEFSLYRYSVVRINFERNSLFFSEVSKGISFSLLSRKVSYPDLIDTLAEIDEEVRLRIPDKYLVAKGWQRT
ncbi:hypothetical protein OH459_28145, partial [Vibrio sp. MM46]|uniref:hypothetical protein n=1 Tax=Vibrio sp. MM46 TaxID=2998835 RepID=UPI0022CD512F